MQTGCRLSGLARLAHRRILLVILATLLFQGTFAAQKVSAQLCVQLNGATYKQDFNTLPASGTSNNANTIPIGFAFSESGTGNNITYAASNGSASTANTYSFGTSASDRALGEITSANFQSIIGACFVNNTGFVIPSMSISYTGEQWRLGAADGITDKLDFQFSTTATSLNTGTYTDINSLDFASPLNTGPVGALDGNAAANRTSKGPIAIIPAGGIPAGATFFIRWVPLNPAGANDGLAIDDFVITYAPSADFDQDQDVDGADFLWLQRNFGTASGASVSLGDANKDGAVDGLDLYIFRTQYGTTRDAPPQAPASGLAPGDLVVPEPAGIGVLALLATCLQARSRRRKWEVTTSCFT